MTDAHLGDSGHIDRGVLADGCMWAPPCFHTNHSILRQNLHRHQGSRVFLGVDVIVNGTGRRFGVEHLGQCHGQSGFACPNRATDTYVKGAVFRRLGQFPYVRKTREY